MHFLARIALSWLVKAVLVMISVAAVTPKNVENTLPRALAVSLLVALVVAPFTGFLGIMLVVPALLGLVIWTVIYALAYGLGPLQSFSAGLVQVALGFVIDLFFFHVR